MYNIHVIVAVWQCIEWRFFFKQFLVIAINLCAGNSILIMTVLISWLSRFKGCPVIAVAAKPGGPEAPDTAEAQGITELIEVRAFGTTYQSTFVPVLTF